MSILILNNYSKNFPYDIDHYQWRKNEDHVKNRSKNSYNE